MYEIKTIRVQVYQNLCIYHRSSDFHHVLALVLLDRQRSVLNHSCNKQYLNFDNVLQMWSCWRTFSHTESNKHARFHYWHDHHSKPSTSTFTPPSHRQRGQTYNKHKLTTNGNASVNTNSNNTIPSIITDTHNHATGNHWHKHNKLNDNRWQSVNEKRL